MNDKIIEDLTLETLTIGIPTLTYRKAAMLKEACVWCLTKCDHSNGVQIKFDICEDSGCYKIKWNNDIDMDGILRAYNADDAIEFGAEAIALLLIKEKTKYTAIERAAKPSGIDYWLGYKNKNSNSLFSKADARLEITGILTERGSNTIKSRINTKLERPMISENVFPVFISVIEFGQPKAVTVRRDGND
jgi:hypothetical protein